MPYVPAFVTAGKVLPTTLNIKNAFRNASEPDRRKRDVRELQGMIAYLPIAVPDLLADMLTRVNNLLGYDTTVTARTPLGEPTAPEEEVRRANEIHARYLDSPLIHETGTILNVLWSGIVAFDMIWTNGVNYHTLQDLIVIDGSDLKIDPDAPLKVSRYGYPDPANTSEYTLEPFSDPAATLVATYNPLRGLKSDYEGGLLRPLLYLLSLLYDAQYDWAAVNEKYGNPPMMVTYPRQMQSQKDQIDKVFTWATTQGMANGVEMPEDIKVAVLELKNLGVNVESFDGFVKMVRSIQSRLILGNDVVNMSQETGSFAKSKEAGKSEAKHNWHDIFLVQRVLNKYVKADYVMNYGEPTTGFYPEFKFVTEEGEDYESNARVVDTLVGAGFDVDPDEVGPKTGFAVTGQRPRVPQGAENFGA